MKVTAILLVTSIATLVQSYLGIKLALLGLFLVAATVNVSFNRPVLARPRLIVFYLILALAGMLWALVGLMHEGTYVEGVFDSVRLYVVWSVAFLVLFSLLRTEPSLDIIHWAMVWSGLLIAAINITGVADQLWGLGIIPDEVRKQLELYVGINDGYIQINSINIGALFVIAPYLLTLNCRKDRNWGESLLPRLALALALVVSLISGRRALWLVLAASPFMILALAEITGTRSLLRTGWRRALICYCVAALVFAGLVLSVGGIQDAGYMRHLKAAFSAQDERSIQKGFLLNGFAESPIVGSGFGAYAGYLRNQERPWTYELTYHQMLFNLGVVGAAIVGGLVATFLGLVLGLLRRFREGAAIPFSLFLGICALFIGSWSNPYLKSFDFLFFVGLLPYLATFQSGFKEKARLAHGGSAAGALPLG